MKKTLLILCSLMIYSCQSMDLKNQSTAQGAQSRQVSNARLMAGDKFRIKVLKRIDISFDAKSGYCGEFDYGANILMKECTRYDRHIPAKTEFDTELSADLRSLLVTTPNSSIHSIKRHESDKNTDFNSFIAEMTAFNKNISIINYEPSNLGTSIPVN